MRLTRQRTITIRYGKLARSGMALLVSVILIHDAVYAQCCCGNETRPEAAAPNSGARQTGPYNDAHSATYSPDGHLIVTAGYGPARIWDVHSGRPVRQIGLAQSITRCVAFSPDGRTIAIASAHPEFSWLRGRELACHNHVKQHSRLTLWDVETGAMIREFEGEKGVFSIQVVDPEDHSRIKEVLTFDGQMEVIRSIAYSSDGTTLLSGGQSGSAAIKIWDVNSGKVKATVDRASGFFEAASFTQDGRRVLSAASLPRGASLVNQAQVEIVTSSVENGAVENQQRWILNPHGFSGTRQFFSPTSELLAAINGNEIHLFAVSAAHEPRVLSGSGKSLSGGVFSSDGNRIAASSYDGPIYVWDLSEENGLPFEINTAGEPARTVAFSPDGRIILSYGKQRLRFWDATTGRSILDDRGNELVIPRVE